MSSEVTPINLTRDSAERLIKELARDSSLVFMPEALNKETWRSRVTNLQVQQCLVRGKVIDD